MGPPSSAGRGSSLFGGNDKIYSHSSYELVLPATTLTNDCYNSMFFSCTSLTTAPALPATTLAEDCYACMFIDCTSLTTAPALPATTMKLSCYSGMFWNCTNLTTAPALPATTLAEDCYSSMFFNCKGLTTAPALPAETLVDFCYFGMFQGCENLNSVTCLATDISATDCTTNWLYVVADKGTFYKSESMEDWENESVDGIPANWTTKSYELLNTPLTFEAKKGCAEVTFTINTTAATNGVEYSTDGTTWSKYTSGTAIALENEGDKVSFRGNNATYAIDYSSGNYSTFSCSDKCYVYGNIMSLVDKDNFATNTTLTDDRTFYGLFYNNTNIYNHEDIALLLPATTLAERCYAGMFHGCTSLAKAPVLPATTLAAFCYVNMFYGCTSLTTAPALPATTLAESCYAGMFSDCRSLTMAPTLPVTTLADGCYANMFSGCTSLTMAPALPATQLTYCCYANMFLGCKKLNNVTCLATDITATDCTYNWLSGVAATGTFTKAASMNSWGEGASGIPSGWTVVNAQ